MSKYPIDGAIQALWPTVYVPPRSTGRSKVCCPVHDDAIASASIDWDNERLYCFVCEARGDALDLIQLERGLDLIGAIEWAEAEIGQGSTSVRKPARRRRASIF